ncbi:MAG: ParB/RepB/Spo0J family partition protein [Anaerolineae bacterium]|nr:ParB/RepB/Spo0J family partition protein [Candidatus Roseilinea sp.]MDW8449785.1 ParB/RepB/Spo0J family partition protein [Anaerolineae bacterium]
MAPKTGLGRGLDALIPGASEAEAGRGGVIEIAVTEIRANPRQPRMVRGQEAMQLEELAASIREHGVIQPLIVTRTQGPGAPYTLIAGERRWRAAQLAGLTHVPVILKDATPQEMLEIALIENIQRNDLSPLEEAAAFQQLINEFGLTPDMVAERVGKSRVAIYNTLRLLKLPGQVQAALMQGDITEGHARALLGLSSAVDQLVALDEIKKHGLNVRQTEELIRRMNRPKTTSKKTERDREWQGAKEYEAKLRDVLGTKVSLMRGRKGGRIVIEFYSDEELGAIYEKIVGSGE